MAYKKRHKPNERVIAERLAHGNLFGAAPGIRQLADVARSEYEEDLSELQVRQRIRARLESQRVTLRRMLLPSLSRRMLRVPLRKVLRALADYVADKSPSNRFGGAVDSLLDKIGLDQWLEDYIWTFATTGEVSPIFEGYTGTVYISEFGPPGDKTPSVWLVATPASDVDALIEWFKEEARKAFPDETFAKRGGKALEGAQYYRWNQEGRSYAEIAHDNISELYPDMFISDDDEEFLFCQKLITRETERVKKLAQRTAERGDIIVDYVSPEEA
jgi:hypothetical protein